MSLPASIPSLPLKVEDYCSEFTHDLSLPLLDLTPHHERAPEIDRPRCPSISSVDTISSPVSPTFPQSSQDELDDCWNLIPYNVPWGNNYHNYEYGTLPGPEGACVFLRSPTPVKNQRTSQACKKCRERKAKVRPFAESEIYFMRPDIRHLAPSAAEPVPPVNAASLVDTLAYTLTIPSVSDVPSRAPVSAADPITCTPVRSPDPPRPSSSRQNPLWTMPTARSHVHLSWACCNWSRIRRRTFPQLLN